MTTPYRYPIGTPDHPWGQAERDRWLAQQQWQRSYQQQVVEPLQQCLQRPEFQHTALVPYGQIDYQALGLPQYAVYAVADRQPTPGAPLLLITGGVHGYETSGVQGALQFIEQHFVRIQQQLAGRANLLVLPCISPWGYETINRWNPQAIDPNRSFRVGSGSAEAELALQCVRGYQQVCGSSLMHIDLHETTDSDNSEFRPAKAARDGTINTNWNIPDGFYLVGDTARPEPEFQTAIIQAVEQVTHIAPADEQGCLIGEPLAQHGVVNYDKKALFLCGGMTDARYVTTTEVYPDSPRTNPTECNAAQVAAVLAAIEVAIKSLA